MAFVRHVPIAHLTKTNKTKCHTFKTYTYSSIFCLITFNINLIFGFEYKFNFR